MATISELTVKLGLNNAPFVKGMQDSVEQVKDLQEGLKEALDELKKFAAGLKAKVVAMQASVVATIAQTRALTASQLAMKALTLGAQLLKVALASTGIGAIVILLGSLAAYLFTTEEGMDNVRKVTLPLIQIFERLKGVLQNLGGSVFKGIAQMLNGELAEGFKTLTEGAKNMGKQTVSAFKDGIKYGSELQKLDEQIGDAELELEKIRGRSKNQIALLTELAKDQSKTEGERAGAAKKAIVLINELAEAEKKYVQLKIREREIINSANNASDADKMVLIQLQNELLDIEADAARQRSRLNNKANIEQDMLLGLLKETNKERQKEVAIMASKRDPFSLENAGKFSKETLDNVKQISEKLLNPALKGAMDQGIIIPQEAIDRIKLAKEEQTQFNKEMAIASTLTGMLSNTFQSAFEGMLNTGKVSFRGIIDGLKALIIRLIAAAAAAFALAAILGALGLGSFTLSGGGFLKGFKELFSSMSGIPFAEGGMVTGLTSAILGDNPSGKEAVIPFEKMGSFLSQYGTGGSQDMRVEVVGRISGEDIFFSGLNYSNGRNKIIGG
jgi:hypothetical protein